MGLFGGEKFQLSVYMFSRFDTIPERHGQTNGQTELLYQYRRCIHVWMQNLASKILCIFV